MSQSKSKLLNYISLLLSDDEALQRFLIDPITDAEGKYGITKAERAVLRRTVFHLSNRSLNGYTLVRHLGSYRRSLRLLQNVLHNVGSKMAQEAHVAATAPAEAAAPAPPTSTYTVVYYYPNTGGTTVDFTAQNNDQVQSNYGGPYSQSVSYTYNTSQPNVTILDLMNAAQNSTGQLPTKYLLDETNTLLTALTLPNGTVAAPAPSFTITGDPTDPRYNLQTNPDANFVFWFWTINGTPLNQSGATGYVVGADGQSFTDAPVLSPNDVVVWQLIAPDATYGFLSCDPTPGNAVAVAAKASKASKT